MTMRTDIRERMALCNFPRRKCDQQFKPPSVSNHLRQLSYFITQCAIIRPFIFLPSSHIFHSKALSSVKYVNSSIISPKLVFFHTDKNNKLIFTSNLNICKEGTMHASNLHVVRSFKNRFDGLAKADGGRTFDVHV